jgi:probable DNA metabolism protein
MENHNNHYYYDGSFNGFLTVLYDMEHSSLVVSELRRLEKPQDSLFSIPEFIDTRLQDAQALWEHLRTANYGALKTLYFAFMSEEEGIEKELLEFYKTWRTKQADVVEILYNSGFKKLHSLAIEVEKEKNNIESKLMIHDALETPCIKFIRPKYNILPLVSKYLRTRYRSGKWMVFDLRRKYGLYHQKGTIAFIPFRPELLQGELMRSASPQTEQYPDQNNRDEILYTDAVA